MLIASPSLIKTVGQAKAALTEYLGQGADTTYGQVDVADPARDARALLALALEVAPDRLILMSDDPIAPATFEAAHIFASRRLHGEPVSHILGYREFFGRRFAVDRSVLDPRPETEMLVAAALEREFADVLDLGTGSGAIIVTLLAERPSVVGVATDLSPEALETARKNAQSLGVADRLHFEVSDWFSAVGGEYDLIVSNPPYIAADEMDGLQPEVREYEPRMALTDEADGLTAYAKIIAAAPDHLRSGGRLMVEIGPTQGAAVSQMMRKAGLTAVNIVQDLDGRDRVVIGEKP